MTPDSEEQRLLELRALRDEAWALLHDDVAALRGDIEERGLGARIVDRVGEEAREVWDQTLDVAAEYRGVVATTVVALIAWLLRRPIAHGVGSMFGDDRDDDAGRPEYPAPADDQGDRT